MTLADMAQITSPQRFVVPLADRAGIPVTSDSRAWIATTSDACAGVDSMLNTYDSLGTLSPATLAGAPADSCGQYFGGLDLQATRNGDRVLLAESGSVFPASGRQPLSFVETATNALVTSDSASSGVFGWAHSATTSFDGQRLLFDMEFLLDGDGNRIGTVQVPDFGTPQSPTVKQVAVLAPRGDRAYVLAGQAQASALRPRVYVVDTSAPVGGALPLLGYFELADVPSGCIGAAPCDLFPPAALSLDGSTLFIAGSDLLVVAPIPTTLVPAATATMRPLQRVAPRAWPVASP